MQVDSSIFKAYDIRGVVDKTLTEDVARAVGRVLGSLAVEANVSAFCVGRDGRLSGERLMNALVEGIASTGMKVLDVGGGADSGPLLCNEVFQLRHWCGRYGFA